MIELDEQIKRLKELCERVAKSGDGLVNVSREAGKLTALVEMARFVSKYPVFTTEGQELKLAIITYANSLA